MKLGFQLVLGALFCAFSGLGIAQSEIKDVDLSCQWTVDKSTNESEIGSKEDFRLSVRSSGAYVGNTFYPYGDGARESRPSGQQNEFRAEVSPDSLTITRWGSDRSGNVWGEHNYSVSRVTLTLKVTYSSSYGVSYEGSGTCKEVPTATTRF